jgi:hypothetical protein
MTNELVQSAVSTGELEPVQSAFSTGELEPGQKFCRSFELFCDLVKLWVTATFPGSSLCTQCSPTSLAPGGCCGLFSALAAKLGFCLLERAQQDAISVVSLP